MYDDSANNTLPEDSQFPDEFYKCDKLAPARGLGNGLLASLIILLPLIILMKWL
jgi:hypothetical protein